LRLLWRCGRLLAAAARRDLEPVNPLALKAVGE